MQNRRTKIIAYLIGVSFLTLIVSADLSAQSDPPPRCAGYGALQSIILTTWSGGLGSWTVGTHDIADPGAFATPDWEVVGSLPGNQSGMAAFVANLDIGDCGTDDQSGALTLDSASISIPANVEVPRISIDHWFQTEFGWDGGNIKISINGGPFEIIPASAFEYSPHNDTLFPAQDEFGVENNSNPLADQEAFTGTIDGNVSGSWIESRINLLGIAQAGDRIELRFDFGVDICDGAVGWYVDDVEVYSCAAELPPSDCGNGVLNAGEQCDDGNDFIGDGCSNTCQVENGWECSAPTSGASIADPGFEAGTPNPSWSEVSNNLIGTPICEINVCGRGGGTGPADGDFWAFFGGASAGQEGSLSQSLVIPSTVSTLNFELEIPACDSASDYVEVLIDDNRELLITGSHPRCDVDGYLTQTVDIRAYADGGNHDLEFHSETFGENGGVSNFFIDVVAIPGTSSTCTPAGPSLTLVKKVVNNGGGLAIPANWTLTASGPSGFSGPGPQVSSGDGFIPGTYDLSESGGQAGYAASDWGCVGGTQDDADTVTLAQGESATCTITNTFIRSTTPINAGHSGAWYNPETAGQGQLIDIDTVDRFMFMSWFTFTDAAAGHPFEQRWLTAQGYYNGSTATLELFETLGGKFDAPQDVTTTPVGEVTLSFLTCNEGQMTYNIEGEGLQGKFPLLRAIPESGNTCEELAGNATQAVDINAGMDGAWFDPATSGQGFLIDSYPDEVDGNFIFVAWFTYGEDTASGQRWFTAQGGFEGSVAALSVYETTDGSFDDPRVPSTVAAGTMSIDFVDCSNAQLTYTLNDGGPEGEVAIQRAVPGAKVLCEEISGTD
jgi:cysteine-rich repeat protein